MDASDDDSHYMYQPRNFLRPEPDLQQELDNAVEQELSDRYLEERQRQYEEYTKQVEEEESKKLEEIEEARKVFEEKIQQFDELIEEVEEQQLEKEAEWQQLIDEHMDLIDKAGGEAAGPVYDDLKEKYLAHLKEGMQWPDEDFDKCQETIEENQETFREEMATEARRAVEQLRAEIEWEESNLEEEFRERNEELQSEIEAAKADYDSQLASETNPSKYNDILEKKEKEIQRLQEEEKKAYEEYQQRSQELSAKNDQRLKEALASEELFAGISAGGNPFDTEEDNKMFQKQKEAIQRNDHQQAYLDAKRHKAQKQMNRAAEKMDHIEEEKRKLGKEEIKAQVMREQIQSQSNEEMRKDVIKSVNAEIESEIEAAEEEKRALEKKHMDAVYSKARERKTAVMQEKAQTDALEKRKERLREAVSDIDASIKGDLNAKQKKRMEREKQDLEHAIKMTDNDIKKMKEEHREKIKELDLEHRKMRQEYSEKKEQLEDKVDQLKALQSELQVEANIDNLNQTLGSVQLDDDNIQIASSSTQRRRQAEDDSLNERAVKQGKQDNMFNEPAKRNVNRMNEDHLRDLKKMKEEGKNISSVEKPNKVRHGDTHIYDTDNIDSLNDTDNTRWGNVSYEKTKGIDETGPGYRRQWKAKGDKDMSKIATHYPDQNLGIVRYNSKKESSKYRTVRSREDLRESRQTAKADENTASRGASQNRTRYQTRSNLEVAAPVAWENKVSKLDDHSLKETISKAKPEEIQDPAKRKIAEPTEGELYVFEFSGQKTVEKAIKDDGLKWKKSREANSQNFHREIYYAGDRGENSSTGFQRHVYKTNDGKRMAVHYVGDATLSVPKKGRLPRPSVE